MAVSKRLRYEILRRDNHACRYCGATAPGAKLNVDHVIPQALGGNDKPDNLVTSCADCNAGKTSSMPGAMVVADVDQDTFRRAAELKRATQPDQETVRIAFHVHLIAVWTWAWNKRSHNEPTKEQEAEAFKQLAILADGSDFTSDHLTQIAFEAGSARSTEPARFIGPNLSDDQFSLGADAVSHWWEAWEKASQGVKPSADQTAEFCDGLHALVLLVDAVDQRDMVMAAAARAGQQRDTSIIRHLSALREMAGPVGGED
ncbi:HNH endonuclease [Streptomyces sp900105755]|uniref:HNH endonuclease n=1 Tax=Streptomyces sp. 900105755 TaxID=3154389 RepID=UPI00331E5953